MSIDICSTCGDMVDTDEDTDSYGEYGTLACTRWRCREDEEKTKDQGVADASPALSVIRV